MGKRGASLRFACRLAGVSITGTSEPRKRNFRRPTNWTEEEGKYLGRQRMDIFGTRAIVILLF
jgi:hypothetical protein